MTQAPSPADAMLDMLRGCWQATFRDLPFEPDLPWAGSGADSLRSLHFMLRLEEALARPLALDLLEQDMTARQLAERLVREEAQATDDDTPLVFLLPGSLGDQPQLAAFRQHLAGTIRFETMRFPDVGDDMSVIGDIPATARLLVPVVQQRQPDGPVHLAGYSFGGIVAVELAHQLVVAGRRIGSLTLLDPFLRHRAFRAIEAAQDGETVPRLVGGNPFATADGGRLALLVDKAAFGIPLTLGALGLARRALLRGAGRLSPETLFWRRQRLIQRLRGRALRRWQRQTIDAPALLVLSDEAHRHFDAGEWDPLVPRRQRLDVGGKHVTLFRAEALARIAPAMTAMVTGREPA
ncbi:thioesterase domain-containing protein [Sphingomonas adhaesiva]|uniref:thioesterase domain-containing protein n=1 Tax=Sphingomonas adhaesiva TaxID=28212 RepID=UPI002FFC6CEE